MGTPKWVGSRALYGCFLVLFAVGLDLGLGSWRLAASGQSFRAAHPFYHHGLVPNRSTTAVWGGRHYRMATNSLGFRDASPRAIDPRAAGPRTLLIGDSMIEGLGVEYPDTVAGILAARGRERGIEVLDAAAVSSSPKIYDLKTRWLVEHEKLVFQRLVVFIDISDIQDETHYAAFVPSDSRNAVAAAAVWWGRHSLSARFVDRFVLGKQGIDNRFTRDADVHAWMDTVDAYRNATGNPEEGRWEWTYDDAVYDAWGARGLALAEEAMGRLVAFCREHEIDVVVVVYPSPFQILANDLESRQVRAWRAFCEREGVDFVNLFPLFIDPRFAGPLEVYDRYFIPDDLHWNEAGNALVADRMEAAVLGPTRP